MWAAWERVIAVADPFLDALTTRGPRGRPAARRPRDAPTAGDQLQRITYHYWSHIGESSAVRQILGHADVPQFVGEIERLAPYRREDGLAGDAVSRATAAAEESPEETRGTVIHGSHAVADHLDAASGMAGRTSPMNRRPPARARRPDRPEVGAAEHHQQEDRRRSTARCGRLERRADRGVVELGEPVEVERPGSTAAPALGRSAPSGG